jgi:acetyltransferase-like isoleucine patch superfamily enzyme
MKIGNSAPAQFVINILLYAFYAAVLGVSLVPSAAAIVFGVDRFILSAEPGLPGLAVGMLLLGLSLGVAFFLYLIWGSIFMAVVIRLLSLGIKPGTYPAVSLTCLRWIVYCGIFTIVVRTILPITVMSFFCKTFFRIVGCKIGRNVYINTPNLNDAQFLTLEDNVVIGGLADITCHTFEANKLTLGRIRIGEGTVIGARAYISPNVDIGKRCVIGVNSLVRKNRSIPDGSVIGTPAGLPIRFVARFERESAPMGRMH